MMNVQTCLETLQTDSYSDPPTDCLHESETHSFLWSPLPPRLPPLSIEVDFNFFFVTPQVWSSKVGHSMASKTHTAGMFAECEIRQLKSIPREKPVLQMETSSVPMENLVKQVWLLPPRPKQWHSRSLLHTAELKACVWPLQKNLTTALPLCPLATLICLPFSSART